MIPEWIGLYEYLSILLLDFFYFIPNGIGV